MELPAIVCGRVPFTKVVGLGLSGVATKHFLLRVSYLRYYAMLKAYPVDLI